MKLEERRKLLKWADGRLEDEHGSPSHGNLREPTSELVYLLLTLQTRISVVRPIFRRLRADYSPWDTLADASVKEVGRLIEPLGLWRVRAVGLIRLAKQVRRDFGRFDLRRLKSWRPDRAMGYLRTLPGVGEKVARCVALYSLDADLSPMDVNATRVLSRFGVLPRSIEPGPAHLWIDRLVEQRASYRLHVNLVAHGSMICVPRGQNCEGCCLAARCRYYRTGQQ